MVKSTQEIARGIGIGTTRRCHAKEAPLPRRRPLRHNPRRRGGARRGSANACADFYAWN